MSSVCVWASRMHARTPQTIKPTRARANGAGHGMPAGSASSPARAGAPVIIVTLTQSDRTRTRPSPETPWMSASKPLTPGFHLDAVLGTDRITVQYGAVAPPWQIGQCLGRCPAERGNGEVRATVEVEQPAHSRRRARRVGRAIARVQSCGGRSPGRQRPALVGELELAFLVTAVKSAQAALVHVGVQLRGFGQPAGGDVGEFAADNDDAPQVHCHAAPARRL